MSLEEDDDLDAFLPLPKKEPDECDDLVDELCQETENLSQETKRAECLRTSSDSESETSDSNSDGPDMRLDLPVWWAKKIKSHMPLPPERDTKKVRKIRLKVVSGCSGLCAEASVLKAYLLFSEGVFDGSIQYDDVRRMTCKIEMKHYIRHTYATRYHTWMARPITVTKAKAKNIKNRHL